MENKKKVFPKLKKKIKWFLTDESGKISKKDALWLAVGGMLLTGVDEVLACTDTFIDPSVRVDPLMVHNSWIVNWHFSNSLTTCAGTHSSAWHVSNVLNWHNSHGSHWSHWSHGSHGSHWSRR